MQIAIDDFGCGYSSLVRLDELPLAKIKLDCAFGTDAVNAPLSKAGNNLAHNSGGLAATLVAPNQ